MNITLKNQTSLLLAALFAGLLALAPLAISATSYDGTTVEPSGDGKTYTVSFSPNDKVTLNNVGQGGQLTLNFGTTGSGSVVVEKLSSVPGSASSAAPGSVLTYFDVTLSGVTNDDISSAAWTFTITKEWLTQQGLSAANVALYHYGNGAWEKLSTTVVSESDTAYTLSAAVNSFSPFAVAGTSTEGSLANTGMPLVAAVVPGVALVAAGAGLYIRGRRS